MKRLIPLALALTAFAAPVKAQYASDKASTWDLTVATFATFQCSASEGLMTLDQSVEGAFNFLRKRRSLEPFQVGNILQTEGFWPAVKAFQKRHGGCPSIAGSIKRRAERDAKPSPIY